MMHIAPEAVITVGPLRNKAVNVRIPFQIPAKGMQNYDKARGKVQGLVLLKKHTGNNAVYGMEKTVKQGEVIEEENAEIFINGENAVTVGDMNQFKGHGSGALHGIKVPTVRTTVHGASKGGIAAIYHFIYVIYYRLTWM